MKVPLPALVLLLAVALSAPTAAHAQAHRATPAGAVATTTTLSATPSPAYVGQTVSFSAKVASSGATPTGSVNFQYGGQTFGTATIVSGTATFSAPTTGLLAGSYTVSAQYTGAGSFTPSFGSATVALGKYVTTTALSTTTSTVVIPAAASFSAQVSRTGSTQAPAGMVTFSYTGGALATVPVNSNGQATFSSATTGVPAGVYTITATYNGDAADSPSHGSVTATAITGTLVTVSIDPLANRHVISPLIYGTNFPPNAQYIASTGQTFTRWGGDNSTGYNWLTGNTNDDFDYFFYNVSFQDNDGDGDPLYSSSQNFTSAVAAAGGTPVIAIGMLPWVAKDDSSYSYSVEKYGAQCATAAPYHPDAGDGLETDCETYISANNPNDAYFPTQDTPGTDDPANTVYRSQWVAALAANFGSAAHVYGIDNEPEIWSAVHHDVHPAAASYEELKSLFLTKPALIRQYDPKATVLGVGASGWYFYWNSQLYAPDKTAHAGVDYNPWLINEIYWADQVSGTRTFDWYDLHAYPDGDETDYTQAQKQALALRVLRDFWDPTYVAEGPDINQQYVTSMQPNRTIAFRIPRMRALINAEYPGTPLTFSEWNAALAGETDFSTALVDVDAWGIFGRENLYAASRWISSAASSPAYNSLLLYRNYDGKFDGFGTTSITASNTGNADLFSSYAALNGAGTQLTLMLINKDPANTTEASLAMTDFVPSSAATYTLSQASPNTIVAGTLAAGASSVTLPPYAAELIVMSGRLSQTPAAEWELNPDATMVPASGTVTLSPKLLSGSGTVTLSNAQSDAGITVTIPSGKITSTVPGSVLVTAGASPGFYHYTVTGTDAGGVAQTQGGYIVVQNPAATLTAQGSGQTAAAGSAITLTAQLNPGNSGGLAAGASVFFTASAGTLSAREAVTDSSGNATVMLQLPATAGTVTVKAEGQYALGHPIATFTETAR